MTFLLRGCGTSWTQCRDIMKNGKPVKDRPELTVDALLRVRALTLNRPGFQSLLDHAGYKQRHFITFKGRRTLLSPGGANEDS